MKSVEDKIDKQSDYYINSPTEQIIDTFLFPTHLGRFIYLPGYRQHRMRFDSFLIMYVMNGSFTLEYNGKKTDVYKGNFVHIDCYREHCYFSDFGWEAIWIHYDGPVARKMYDIAIAKLGNIFTLDDPFPIMNRIERIFQPFTKKEPIRDALISKYLNDILTEFIIYSPFQLKETQRANIIDNVKMFIHDHIQEELKIDLLAKQALMSTYHFIRVFKKETGVTPHEYIVNYRIGIAKILLLKTNLSVYDISYESGFSSESVFCAAFKNRIGVSPTIYRKERTQQ